MPKMKTHSGAKKRFKRAKGGLKRRASNRAHILTKKAPKRKRQLRALRNVNATDTKSVDKLLKDK